MTQDEVIELGVRADALLNSQTFKFVVSRLGDSYANNILLSRPHERMVREENYNLHKALGDLVGQLGAFVQAKDEIVKALEQKEQEDNE